MGDYFKSNAAFLRVITEAAECFSIDFLGTLNPGMSQNRYFITVEIQCTVKHQYDFMDALLNTEGIHVGRGTSRQIGGFGEGTLYIHEVLITEHNLAPAKEYKKEDRPKGL